MQEIFERMFINKAYIYLLGFHVFEGVLLLIPVLPSSLEIRIIIVSFYFTGCVFNVPFNYWSWKKSILNQFIKRILSDPEMDIEQEDIPPSLSPQKSFSTYFSTSTSTSDLKQEDSDYTFM